MENDLETLLYEALERPLKDNGNNQYLYLELQKLQKIAETIINSYGYCEGVRNVINLILSKQDTILKNLPLN